MSIQQEIRQFILENFLFTTEPSALTNGESLLDRGIMDSTGVLELVAFLEERIGVQVADDELLPENLDSVDRIMTFVLQKRDVASGA